MSPETTLHGIPIRYADGAIACPIHLRELAHELARVYGTEQVRGYNQPHIAVLRPGPAIDDTHHDARLLVRTALRTVSPITDCARAVDILRRESPWLPPVAP